LDRVIAGEAPGMPWEPIPWEAIHYEQTARDYNVIAAGALRLGHLQAARKAAMRAEQAQSRVRRYAATAGSAKR
jgi:hypothetical protein